MDPENYASRAGIVNRVVENFKDLIHYGELGDDRKITDMIEIASSNS